MKNLFVVLVAILVTACSTVEFNAPADATPVSNGFSGPVVGSFGQPIVTSSERPSESRGDAQE